MLPSCPLKILVKVEVSKFKYHKIPLPPPKKKTSQNMSEKCIYMLCVLLYGKLGD